MPMFSTRTWIIIAAAVGVAWWFLFRKKAQAAGADSTVTGQPVFAAGNVSKLTMEPIATQGTQIQKSRIPVGVFNTLGASPMSITGADMPAGMLAPRTMMDKAASAARVAAYPGPQGMTGAQAGVANTQGIPQPSLGGALAGVGGLARIGGGIRL